MKGAVGRAIGERYGIEMGVQERVGQSLLDKIGLTEEQRQFADRIFPECWLALRLDEFHKDIQVSFFVLSSTCSRYAARFRTRKKSSIGLTYMREAEFSVTGGCPLAHCTVLLRKKRDSVAISFLEKDRTRRSRSLNLGKFLLGVTLRAVAPFCKEDADLTLEAKDNGSGRLVAYYRKLGLEPKARNDIIGSKSGCAFVTQMAAKMVVVLAMCNGSLSEAYASSNSTAEGTNAGASASEPQPCKRKRTQEPCAVCLELLHVEGGDEREVSLLCGHRFHAACIKKWLAKMPSCPLCKRAVVGASIPLPTPCLTPRR